MRATSAPSVYNTQPWSLTLQGDRLDLYADPGRQLTTLEPSGRQLTISCGAALCNARASLAAGGYDVRVDRSPDPGNTRHLARVTALGDARPQSRSRASTASPATLGLLDQFAGTRHTNRHPFSDDHVPAGVLARLTRAVAAEDGALVRVNTRERRSALAAVTQRARAQLHADPAYLAEARGWGLRRRGGADEVDGDGCILVVAGDDDDPSAWLRAGEALQRMLLEATRQGYAVDPMAQWVVTAADRNALRTGLAMTSIPQVVLRLGHAPVSLASRRRRLVDVLTEA